MQHPATRFKTRALSALTLALLAVLSAPAPQGAQAQSGPRASDADAPTWVGVVGGKPEQGQRGLLIKRVLRSSPAERAGLRAGDLLIKANDQPVQSVQELRQATGALRVGQVMTVELVRDRKPIKTSLTLVALPTQVELIQAELMGKPMPDLSYQLVESGTTGRLHQLKGKIVVLEFWATWCSPCKQTASYLAEYYPAHRDAVHVLALSSEPADKLKAYLEAQTTKPPYLIGHDPGEQAHQLLLINSYPTILILDEQLMLRKVLTGFHHPSEIGRTIEQLRAAR